MYCMDYKAASCGKKICCYDCDLLRCIERCKYPLDRCNLRVENEPKSEMDEIEEQLKGKEIRLPSGQNVTEYIKHPALIKHLDIIEKMIDKRVFGIFCDKEKGFWIEECCDNWFGYNLTKEDCLELSRLFQDIANEL